MKTRSQALVGRIRIILGVGVALMLVPASAAEPQFEASSPHGKSIDKVANALQDANLSNAEKEMLSLIFTSAYDDKTRLIEIVCGRFQVMRVVASFYISTDGKSLTLLDSPPQPAIADFAMPIVAVFTRENKIVSWDVVSPDSAGLLRIEYDGKHLVLRSKANWIGRANWTRYLIVAERLVLSESRILPLQEDDKPILADISQEPSCLIEGLRQLRRDIKAQK